MSGKRIKIHLLLMSQICKWKLNLQCSEGIHTINKMEKSLLSELIKNLVDCISHCSDLEAQQLVACPPRCLQLCAQPAVPLLLLGDPHLWCPGGGAGRVSGARLPGHPGQPPGGVDSGRDTPGPLPCHLSPPQVSVTRDNNYVFLIYKCTFSPRPQVRFYSIHVYEDIFTWQMILI